MLKPIPQEIQQKQKFKQKKKQAQPLVKLELKLSEEKKAERHLVKTACLNLMEYIKKAEVYGVEEISELIHHLQRTVLSLEKKRTKLLRKQGRKKK